MSTEPRVKRAAEKSITPQSIYGRVERGAIDAQRRALYQSGTRPTSVLYSTSPKGQSFASGTSLAGGILPIVRRVLAVRKNKGEGIGAYSLSTFSRIRSARSRKFDRMGSVPR